MPMVMEQTFHHKQRLQYSKPPAPNMLKIQDLCFKRQSVCFMLAIKLIEGTALTIAFTSTNNFMFVLEPQWRPCV